MLEGDNQLLPQAVLWPWRACPGMHPHTHINKRDNNFFKGGLVVIHSARANILPWWGGAFWRILNWVVGSVVRPVGHGRRCTTVVYSEFIALKRAQRTLAVHWFSTDKFSYSWHTDPGDPWRVVICNLNQMCSEAAGREQSIYPATGQQPSCF